MWEQAMAFNKRDEVCDVENEQDWPQYGALWDATDKTRDGWLDGPAAYVLVTAGQLRLEPPVGDIMDLSLGQKSTNY